MLQRLTPSRWRGGFRELGIVMALYGAYWLTRGSLPYREVAALQNAFAIVDLETRLGFFCELDIQSWCLDHSIFIEWANSVYTYFYYPSLVLFFVWAYNRHREKYFTLRNAFLISAGIGFLCFALYPVMPPRLLPGYGFVDTMAGYGSVDYGSSFFGKFANPYAAMPSLHFGWVLLVGIGTIYVSKNIFLRVLGVFVPLSMLMAIVVTGNHFWLDAIAGGLLVTLAFRLAISFNGSRNLRISLPAILKRSKSQEQAVSN